MAESAALIPLGRQCLGHKAIGSTMKMKYVEVSHTQATEAAQAALMMIY